MAQAANADRNEREIAAWILEDGYRMRRTRAFFGGLCEKLNEAGLPVARAMMSMRTLHPNVLATTYRWQRDAWCSEEIDRAHGILQTDMYRNSPIRVVHETGERLRYRLAPGRENEFPILDELVEEGMTDYVALPIHFSQGQRDVITFATDRPSGFEDNEIELLERIARLATVVLEVQSTRRIAVSLLDTYVGHASGERIMEGHIRRGDVEEIEAAIMIADLRGFTRLTDRLPGREVVELLDDYFDCLTRAVSEQDGEVLKFIGDAMLAIFPLDGDTTGGGRRALAAAAAAARDIDRVNRERVAARKPAIDYGMALHVGRVLYGNIGGADRLDFTVIGPAVNHAARLEGLCRTLQRRILVSEPLARACPPDRGDACDLIDLGEHRLRDVDDPQRVFCLPVDADATETDSRETRAAQSRPAAVT